MDNTTVEYAAFALATINTHPILPRAKQMGNWFPTEQQARNVANHYARGGMNTIVRKRTITYEDITPPASLSTMYLNTLKTTSIRPNTYYLH